MIIDKIEIRCQVTSKIKHPLNKSYVGNYSPLLSDQIFQYSH